jgi:hypothetical protein
MQATWHHPALAGRHGSRESGLLLRSGMLKKSRTNVDIRDLLSKVTKTSLTASFEKTAVAFHVGKSMDSGYEIEVAIFASDTDSLTMVKKDERIHVKSTWLISSRTDESIHKISNTSTLDPDKDIDKREVAYYEILAMLQPRNSQKLVSYLVNMSSSETAETVTP